MTSIPRYCRAFRKRTPPLARERSQGRSESTVFCRAAGGRVAQIAGPSAPGGRILDSVAVFFGGGGRGYAFDGKTRHFADIGRRFFDSVVNSGGK